MLSVFLTVLPVFLIMGAGYISGRVGYISLGVADGLNTYAIKVAIPVLLFFGMFQLDLGKALIIPMLVSFYAGAFLCFTIAIILSRKLWNRRPGESVSVGFSATFSNTVLMGIPVAILAFGSEINNFIFGIIALHASLIYIVGILTMEFARQGGQSFGTTIRTALKAIFSNSLMIGILCGLAANLLALELPDTLHSALEMVKVTGIPAALFGIGISLNKYSITEGFSEAVMVSLLAVIVHPLITLSLALPVFNLSGMPLYAAVVLACMPPGMNIYIFASMYNRAIGLSASVLIIANLLAIFTIPFWLLILRSIG